MIIITKRFEFGKAKTMINLQFISLSIASLLWTSDFSEDGRIMIARITSLGPLMLIKCRLMMGLKGPVLVVVIAVIIGQFVNYLGGETVSECIKLI